MKAKGRHWYIETFYVLPSCSVYGSIPVNFSCKEQTLMVNMISTVGKYKYSSRGFLVLIFCSSAETH
jgi:hypothetical protein